MSQKSIAVVGAGLAGLTCAYRLQSLGQDVHIFEARERLGGRVHSVISRNARGQDSVVELGGQNITDGGVASHFMRLVDELRLRTIEKTICLKLGVYSNGCHMPYNDLLQKQELLEGRIRELATNSESIGSLIDMVTPCDSALNLALKTRMQAYEGVAVYEQSIYHNLDTLLCAIEGGIASVYKNSETPDDQILVRFLEGGNAQLPEALGAALKNRPILNKVLTQLSRQDNQILLSFEDCTSKKYDYVVIALPLAVLQNFDLTAWGMPGDKCNQIHKIQHGGNYKIAIPLETRERNDYAAILAQDAIAFFNFDEQVLLLYATKPLKNPKETLDIALKGFGIREMPQMDLPLRTSARNFEVMCSSFTHDWRADPYARSSYVGYSRAVSMALDQHSQENEIFYKSLFSPLNQQVFFAGEHTTLLECIGTMEAAVESGERSALGIFKSIIQS